MKIKYWIFILILLVAGLFVYKYSVHPVVLRTLFPSKIWPHRVNSITKLEETASLFRGFEIDVVWEDGKLDINHPPEKSIYLYLDEFVKHIPSQDDYGLWLDYKNLEKKWANESAIYVDSILVQENIDRNRVYVESYEAQYLSPFTKKGFKASYYLPSNLNLIKEGKDLEKILNEIDSKLNGNSQLFISAPFSDYQFIKTHYPERKKIIWHLGGFHGPINKIRIYRALLDNKVEVVLLPFKSQQGDR